MFHRILFVIALMPISISQTFASETLLEGYEPSETNLYLSSPDSGMTLTKVLGGIGGTPAPTQGNYILKATWTGQTDGKIEIKHRWTDSTFSLTGKRLNTCRCLYDDTAFAFDCRYLG